MDFRLTDDGRLYLLEPNPNPDLNRDEDLAQSAASVGITYPQLIQRVINLGLRFREGR
jgi:D-alanine-D-alanine ligase